VGIVDSVQDRRGWGIIPESQADVLFSQSEMQPFTETILTHHEIHIRPTKIELRAGVALELHGVKVESQTSLRNLRDTSESELPKRAHLQLHQRVRLHSSRS
jgi:hypothetical protein